MINKTAKLLGNLAGQYPQQTGAAAVFLSAFAFYGATFIIQYAARAHEVHIFFFILTRFWVGYLFLLLWFKNRTRNIVNKKWVWMRAAFNSIAVMFFFISINVIGVTKANLFNMTYPAFVALLAPVMIKEKNNLRSWAGVILAISGSIMILKQNTGIALNGGDILGLLSGLTAGIAILSLRKARLSDQVDTVLFFQFRLGAWVFLPATFVIAMYTKNIPVSFDAILWLVISGVVGLTGQVLLTYGFRLVSAVEGSILSSSRILIALVISMLFMHSELSYIAIAGALLLFIANAIIAVANKK